MRPHDIDVLVTEAGVAVQRWRCTTTTMPDGAPGVIWRGVAYRLLPGDQIDVAVPDMAKLQPEKVPAGYLVLPGEDATWILVAGLQGHLQNAVRALEGAGATILRSGRWLGEPVDDVVYDWFVCCAGDVDTPRLAAIIGAGPAAPVDDTGARVAALEQRVSELIAELKKARAIPPTPVPPPEAPSQPPLPPLQSDPDLLDALTTIESLHRELASIRERQAATPAPPTVVRLHDELSEALAALRPDVTLLRNSWRIATSEFQSRTVFWRMIGELPRGGGRPEGWKPVRAVERWWERHVSQGQDYTGRAYARYDTASGLWEVLLGWKADQLRDIEWLKRQS